MAQVTVSNSVQEEQWRKHEKLKDPLQVTVI